MGGIFPYLYFFFVSICILTLESNFYLFIFHVRLRGTTKEAFVAYAIQLALEHRQHLIQNHGTEVIETTTKYHTIMGIPFSSSS
jgi:hypothetical protein